LSSFAGAVDENAAGDEAGSPLSGCGGRGGGGGGGRAAPGSSQASGSSASLCDMDMSVPALSGVIIAFHRKMVHAY